MNKDTITLGSGQLYVTEFSGEIPEDTVLETDDNRLGYIKGGATIAYTPTEYEAKDDFGVVSKVIITEEEAILSTGLITWCGNTLNKLCSTARTTEDSSEKVRTVKIGGTKNDNGKKYIIHFVHQDPVDGDVRVTIVGRNRSGFSLAFVKDQETTLNAEFKAAPCDEDGTLIIYKEKDDTIVQA